MKICKCGKEISLIYKGNQCLDCRNRDRKRRLQGIEAEAPVHKTFAQYRQESDFKNVSYAQLQSRRTGMAAFRNKLFSL